jgi:hypothetical protein
MKHNISTENKTEAEIRQALKKWNLPCSSYKKPLNDRKMQVKTDAG